MTITDFLQNNNGRLIDVDQVYGGQCWDLAAAYCRDYVGVPSPFLPTTNGSVYSSFRDFPTPLGEYFDKIINDHANPNQCPKTGDIVFFDESWVKNGHVGIKVDDSQMLMLFEQNNPTGSAAHLVSHPTAHYKFVAGWLRPKKQGDDMSTVDKGLLRVLAYGVLGDNGLGLQANRPNAAVGDIDSALSHEVGAETNKKIWEYWNSPQAIAYRNQELPMIYELAKNALAYKSQLTELQASGVVDTAGAELLKSIENYVKVIGK